MNRRGLLAGFATISGLFGVSAARATTVSAPDKAKVVYHLNELDKVHFVLGNIENHFEGMGGPSNVTIALVVHGPALKAFHASTANPDVRSRFSSLMKAGLSPGACARTMKGQNVAAEELLPGFVTLDRGGVVRLAELQSRGYVYLKP